MDGAASDSGGIGGGRRNRLSRLRGGVGCGQGRDVCSHGLERFHRSPAGNVPRVVRHDPRRAGGVRSGILRRLRPFAALVGNGGRDSLRRTLQRLVVRRAPPPRPPPVKKPRIAGRWDDASSTNIETCVRSRKLFGRGKFRRSAGLPGTNGRRRDATADCRKAAGTRSSSDGLRLDTPSSQESRGRFDDFRVAKRSVTTD